MRRQYMLSLVVLAVVITSCGSDRPQQLGAGAAPPASSANAEPPASKPGEGPPVTDGAVWADGPARGQAHLQPKFIPSDLTLLNDFKPGEFTPPPEPGQVGQAPPVHHRLYGIPRVRGTVPPSSTAPSAIRYLTINVYYGKSAPPQKDGGTAINLASGPATYFGPDRHGPGSMIKWSRPDGLDVAVGGEGLTYDELVRVAGGLQ